MFHSISTSKVIKYKYRITSNLFKSELKAVSISEIHDFMKKFKSHITDYSVLVLGVSDLQNQYSNRHVA
ncbi:hypothetical protein [uncultured Polaribacter sp.]|uniref:hypothetical protein n=1 Tax=uncultured Polaribacter sp. TaxID=174711 RepID=UPI002612080B|nr:hypothetical protein [uncultured Polaribacter sp.]